MRSKTQLIATVVNSVGPEGVTKTAPEIGSSPAKYSTPNPSRQDDEDTITTPDLSLMVGERLRGEETETSEAWMEGDETGTVSKKS